MVGTSLAVNPDERASQLQRMLMAEWEGKRSS
jgi:hypothetical protein